MKRILTAAVFVLFLATILNAQSRPPLIDREIFFGNPEIAAAQISPDGKYLSFMKPWNDTMNVWVKKVEEPFSAARRLTSETRRPIASYNWSRDARFVIYVKDNAGDENFNVYSVDPAAPVTSGTDAPPSRDLTGLKGVRVLMYSVPKNDPDTIYIGLNDRDKSWHDLYKLKLSTGERTLVRQNTEKIADWFFDLKGELRLALRTADNGDQEILRVDPAGFTKVYSCNVFETCATVRFHKDGKRVYMVTNKGENVNLIGLVLFDPATRMAEPVESDPLKKIDLGGQIFSEATDDLLFTVYREDRARRYFRDKTVESDFNWLAKQVPGREFGIGSRSTDERFWIVTANGDAEPGATYLFDRKARKLTLQYRIREKLPRAALASVQSIRYKSSDGLEIPAYLTLPKGVTPKSLPMVVVPHGGPWGRDFWGYNGMAQFLANRGYAVLMPNFRGSTGYGKDFLNAGNGEWGRKMQDDITWGVNYLISQGTVDPKRVGIMGGSYGGYATLAGVAFTPDLYKAAVDIVGPSNLVTLLESTPPYWEAQRKFLFARMADLNTPAGQAWLKERSPLHSADKIKTPLLVVQGANDPRVNKAEAEQIVVALRDRGFPVEYLLAPDEGHGFARPVNNMAMYMAAERFLAKHLDSLFQDGGTPEAAARLKEITVDPKTVVLAKKLDAATAGVPKTAVDLQPGTYKYKAVLAAGPQQLSLSLVTTIREENGAWLAMDTMETPVGPATDTAILEKGSLTLRKRTIQQGPVAINLDVAGNKATGNISMSGKEIPISLDLPTPLFAAGAAAMQSIAALPLTDGYTTTFRGVDLQRQKVTLIQLKVSGSESVKVPAGVFETFKVEAASDDGSMKMTLWVAKDSRRAVKGQLANGPSTVTMESEP
jgi:dipeptidyl aminopeptidase/acylaminoacyl peptidase